MSFSPIAYKTDKYDMLKGGVELFTTSTSTAAKAIRNVVWVFLRDKTTGECFIVANVNWAENNTKHVTETTLILNQLKDTYDVPVFCTGDFGLPTQAFATTEMQNATTPGEEDVCHIFYKDGYGVTVNEFKACTQNMFAPENRFLSNRAPIYADFDLTESHKLTGTIPDYTYTPAG